MNTKRFSRNTKLTLACAAALIALTAPALTVPALAQDQKAQEQQADQHDSALAQQAKARAGKAAGQGVSNEKVPNPPRIEDSYPLASDADRAKTSKDLQQTVVDLLALFNDHKEAHWNLNGPLYLPLHEFYQEQADMYRKYADVFAERNLSLGYSIDGRYRTIATTSTLPDMPGGYITDNESLKLLIDRVTLFQKETYKVMREVDATDPVTSNKYQDLLYDVDHNLWQLRIHLKKPGGLGQDLPWAGQQSRDRAGQ